MKNEIDILKDVSKKLEKTNISYMLTGSLAMNYYAQSKDSLSEIQLMDVQNLILAGYDKDYTQKWIEKLNLSSIFKLIENG